MKEGSKNSKQTAGPSNKTAAGGRHLEGATVVAPPARSAQREQQPEKKLSSTPPRKKSHSSAAKGAPAGRPTAAQQSSPQPAGGKKSYAPALTQIHQSMVKQDNSQGFAKAKRTADSALANNHIVLNRRFVLENTLGAGGMGTVYKAKDLRKIEASDKNPYVAIKVLNEDFKNHPDAFVTLQRETSRSHRLSHPKIVTVHDFDRDGDVIYMTMELLQGLPLDNVLRRISNNGLAQEKALPILADICDALAYAHQKGIVHCDLKPGNIFVTKETTKVLDFGIARITASGDDFDSGSLGALTPSYASLEMLEGQAPHPADDLYAIGLIAYELLSGRHPYDRKPASKASAAKMKPQKLPALNKRQWQALEQALQFERAQRQNSVDEFKKAFFQERKFPVFKAASAFLFCAVAALTYLTLFKVDDIQDRVQTLILSAASCTEQKDWPCALEKYQTVLELQPDNKQVQKLKTQTEEYYKTQRYDQIMADINQCLTEQQDVLCALSKKEQAQLLNLSEQQLEKINTTLDTYQKNSKIQQLLSKADNCLQRGQFDCAKDYGQQILELAPDNSQAAEINRQAHDLQQQQLAATRANERAYKQHLQQGRHCLDSGDFQCAIQQFDLAIKVDDRSEARGLKQQAEFAEKNKRQSYAKASKLASKAEECYQRKNFSCAISNAESSLEFVADYPRATAIRTQAIAAQEKAKSAFTIK